MRQWIQQISGLQEQKRARFKKLKGMEKAPFPFLQLFFKGIEKIFRKFQTEPQACPTAYDGTPSGKVWKQQRAYNILENIDFSIFSFFLFYYRFLLFKVFSFLCSLRFRQFNHPHKLQFEGKDNHQFVGNKKRLLRWEKLSHRQYYCDNRKENAV